MSLIFCQNEIVGMLTIPIENERRALAVIDEQYEVIYANTAFNAHFGLDADKNKPLSLGDILPVNVRYAYQDFMKNSSLLSTRMVSDLFFAGLEKKQTRTLSFSKINVESRVLSLLILIHDPSDVPPLTLVS
ncbi:transcriptional regulator [Affinibrenneria salicis]|uniref:Transcriptional regulator n=1 Tax=Affinibrenneria salicis TaxID=2590031 RepID=A0A5J5FWF0_9GAMM|nr:transcriptional regulator [Affinibrenneria salicis]KAA8998102.1 transcriptional regulator [Affinibrenneria salicis]